MVGRRPRIALVASVFLLAGSQSAFAADDDGSPFQQLVQVYVPDAAAVDRVVSQYDAAEYRSVQDDGSILLAVFVTADEKADLKAKGYKIGRVMPTSR
jgi:Tol biopolymer transport system component